MNFFCQLKIVPIRTLFSREELGVTQIESLRRRVLHQFDGPAAVDLHKKNFVANFTGLMLEEKRDKLKEYIVLIDRTSDDLKSLKSLLIQYYDAYYNVAHNVNDFCFATQIMRMLYLLNIPDEAVKVEFRDLKIVHDQFAFKFNAKSVSVSQGQGD